MWFLGRFDALELLFGAYRTGLESLGSIGFELVKICEFLVAACEEPEFRLSIRNSGWGFRFSQNRNSGWATGLPDGGFFRTLVFLVFGFLGVLPCFLSIGKLLVSSFSPREVI